MSSALVELLSVSFKCFKAERIIYLSTPVNGGLCRIKYPKDFMERNARHASNFASQVMALTGAAVINPAALSLPEMTQKDYLDLWKRVIGSLATEVWFNDGWEYSNGCAEEYSFSLRLHLPVFNAEGNRLCAAKAAEKMRGALSVARGMGLELAGVSQALDALNASI